MVKVRGQYSERLAVRQDFLLPSKTKQAHRDECDINRIMAKYQRTGALTHFNTHGARYGFVPSADFQTMVNKVKAAENMFADLPSSLRQKFNYSPEQFLAFVQNPANVDEMVSLGLAVKAAAPVGDAAEVSSEGVITPPA